MGAFAKSGCGSRENELHIPARRLTHIVTLSARWIIFPYMQKTRQPHPLKVRYAATITWKCGKTREGVWARGSSKFRLRGKSYYFPVKETVFRPKSSFSAKSLKFCLRHFNPQRCLPDSPSTVMITDTPPKLATSSLSPTMTRTT